MLASLQVLGGKYLSGTLVERAGGGGRSSGSSHSSSSRSVGSSGFHSSSRGGSGGGSILGALFGILVLGLLVVLVLFFVRRGMKKRGITTGQLKSGFASAQANFQQMAQGLQGMAAAQGAAAGAGAGVGGVQAGIEAIRAHDPGFDEYAFLAEVQRSFFLVQQAWCECRPDLSRRVMGDSLWQQHKVGIEEYQRKAQHNVMDSLAVGRADITAASTNAQTDSITVRVVAASSDYDVDNEKGKVTRGDKSINQWSEDWVLTRDSSATTKQGAGTLNQRCPNCGAPLDIDLSGTCKYCKVTVMSGKYDWVLSRISQADLGNF